ncbi:MAG: RIP metalloprotease RseP [Alphaproteobacteria bacterium]|nr:RIP metalloprotease RseP [Alphaproteobacteria bacterium]
MAVITSLAAFIGVLTVLVFFHELGHYGVARWRGVGVEVFSIGLGREIFGWTDKSGTRWKISWIPVGGYVKFVGDLGVASAGVEDREYTPEELAVAFHTKPLASRAAVVAAGPIANFVLAILILAGMFMTVGQRFTPPTIGSVVPDTVADAAGFQQADRILAIDSTAIEKFEDVLLLIRSSPGRELRFVVERAGTEVVLLAAPDSRMQEVAPGVEEEVGFLGVGFGPVVLVRRGPGTALWYATKETYFISKQTLIFLGRMVTGSMAADGVRGPIGIAQMSGQAAQCGLTSIFFFIAVLSISLGLINLFPIPILDGGHLLFYAYEFVRGKPLGPKAQDIGFRIGLTMVLMLMVFATWQDLGRLNLAERLSGLF